MTRTRIRTGIYKDQFGFCVIAFAHGQRRQMRFPPTTPISTMVAWRKQETLVLAATVPAAPARGTLAEAIERYLAQLKYLDPATLKGRRSELQAWREALGTRPLASITSAHIRAVVGDWTHPTPTPGHETPKAVSAKTVQNRVRSLGHLYRTLHGKRTVTPVDDLDLPKPQRVRPRTVSADVIVEVAAKLKPGKTKARFMVLASTGIRPAQLKRMTAADVDLARGICRVPGAKDGLATGLMLNTDMVYAWKAFIAADAWGAYDTRSFARALHTAGWPKDVRPYNLRHSMGMALSENGEDLADVGAWLGHTSTQTTRNYYVPVLTGRLADASKRLEGRLPWKP
ncbi:MAG: tyrosine-type recombinase/integrase [Candidatus Nanopelagicales bacterium]